jgi:hypothetical protein
MKYESLVRPVWRKSKFHIWTLGARSYRSEITAGGVWCRVTASINNWKWIRVVMSFFREQLHVDLCTALRWLFWAQTVGIHRTQAYGPQSVEYRLSVQLAKHTNIQSPEPRAQTVRIHRTQAYGAQSVEYRLSVQLAKHTNIQSPEPRLLAFTGYKPMGHNLSSTDCEFS